MDDQLCKLSAIALRPLILAREVSPVELVSAVLERAERLQPALNCFISLCPEQALDQARRADDAIARGHPLGLLHGIPFSVKDIVNTQGVATTFGALPFRENHPTEDAVSVARLREQGAILIGKTTTPEFGSKCLTDSPLFGRTRNAWHAGHTSGGSSGGAAVAVASGIAPLGVATDGGGSTRIPAACNGVVGIKPSHGAIPHSQAQDLFGNQTYVTPMTRTVGDTALMMQVMAGEHACDPWSIGACKPDYLEAAGSSTGMLPGSRIGYCLVPPGRPVSEDVKRTFDDSLRILASLGAELESFSGDGFEVEPVWRAINHTVWRTRFGPLLARFPGQFSDTFVRQVESAAEVSGVDYQQAMFERSSLFLRVQALFDRFDFLVMPTTTRTALPIDQDLFGTIEIGGREYENVRANWFPWTMPFNMTGHPAVSLPCGFGTDGLPIGLQVVAPFRRDLELLRLAALFESSVDLHRRWPDAGSYGAPA